MKQIIDIVLPIVAGIALIWMQVILSKSNSKKAGFLFPAIFLSMSILYVLFIFVFAYPHMESGSIQFSQIAGIFLVFNIPTLVLGGLHLVIKKVVK